ncbi:MAG: SDR family oxidoreductase [Planctomycetaceae bacterium]
MVAVSRSVELLGELEELSSARLITQQTDVTKSEELDRLVDFTQRRLRHVDILCPLAGYLGVSVLGQSPVKNLDALIKINSLSAWETFEKFKPILSKMGAVCMATPAPLLESISGLEAFCVSKAPLKSLIRTVGKQQEDLRINGVACSPVKTTAWELPELERVIEAYPWKWLRATEVAETILFLVSEEGRAIRGEEIILSSPIPTRV